MIEVISTRNYSNRCDGKFLRLFSLATEDRVTALVANLPIRRTKVRAGAFPSAPPVEVSSTPPPPPEEAHGGDGGVEDLGAEQASGESLSEVAFPEAATPEVALSEAPPASEDSVARPSGPHLAPDS
jgi:hypothetical protein